MTAAWNYIKMEELREGWPAHSAVKTAVPDVFTAKLGRISGVVFVLKTRVKGSVQKTHFFL